MRRSVPDASPAEPAAPAKRPVGRPKLDIDPAEVAAVAAKLYDEHGHEAVSIESVAEGLGVSRATLYRTVGSLDELHAILLERVIQGVEQDARTLLSAQPDAGHALVEMIRFQVHASVRMRNYVGVYFGWGLSPETYTRWRAWAGGYEALWKGVVQNAVDAGYLASDDVAITTRLIMGMINWVSRWYRPKAHDADKISDAAVRLILPDWDSGPPARSGLTAQQQAAAGPPAGPTQTAAAAPTTAAAPALAAVPSADGIEPDQASGMIWTLSAELERLRADASRDRDELRRLLDERAQMLSDARDEQRHRAERAERDLDAARAELDRIRIN